MPRGTPKTSLIQELGLELLKDTNLSFTCSSHLQNDLFTRVAEEQAP